MITTEDVNVIEIILQVMGILIVLVPAVYVSFRKLAKRLNKVDEINNKLDKHIMYDLKDKIRNRYYYFRNKVENDHKIYSLEVKEAFDLVIHARENGVNGETTAMQEYIVQLYNAKLGILPEEVKYEINPKI